GMSFGLHAAEDFRMLFAPSADGEKDGPRVVTGEAIKDGRREFRVRTVIEREQDRLVRIAAQSVNHPQRPKEHLSAGGLDPHVDLRILWLTCGQEPTKQPNRRMPCGTVRTTRSGFPSASWSCGVESLTWQSPQRNGDAGMPPRPSRQDQ